MSLQISSQVTSRLLSAAPLPLTHNLVIFGESGVGKSSIVNMLAGEKVFEVGGDAQGTTFDHQGCAIQFGDLNMNVWDTVGLNMNKDEHVKPEKALEKLFDLLGHSGGVSLLIFVMRFRITDSTVDNYHLMRDVLCGARVPMVVAITNREFETDNEEWWPRNEEIFSRNRMAFIAHAIGTAKQHLAFDRTYTDLREGLQHHIQQHGKTKPRFTLRLESSDASEEPRYLRFERAVANAFGRFMGIFRKSKEALLGLYGDVLRKNGVPDEEAARSTQRVRVQV